jgi:hypothetical protein
MQEREGGGAVLSCKGARRGVPREGRSRSGLGVAAWPREEEGGKKEGEKKKEKREKEKKKRKWKIEKRNKGRKK